MCREHARHICRVPVAVHVPIQKGSVSTGSPIQVSAGDNNSCSNAVNTVAAITAMFQCHAADVRKVTPSAMEVSAGENPHTPPAISSHGHPVHKAVAMPMAEPATAQRAARRSATHRPIKNIHPAGHESMRNTCDNPFINPCKAL